MGLSYFVPPPHQPLMEYAPKPHQHFSHGMADYKHHPIHEPGLRWPKKPEEKQFSHEYSPDGYDHGLLFDADKPWEHAAFYPPVAESHYDHPFAVRHDLHPGSDHYHPDGHYIDYHDPKKWDTKKDGSDMSKDDKIVQEDMKHPDQVWLHHQPLHFEMDDHRHYAIHG